MSSMSHPIVSESDSHKSQEDIQEESTEADAEVFYPAEEEAEETPRRSTRRKEAVYYNYSARRGSKKRNTSPLEEARSKSQKMSPIHDMPLGGHLLNRTPQGKANAAR